MIKEMMQFELDRELMDEASDLLEAMGLDLSTVFNMLASQIVLKRKLPFTPEVPKLSRISLSEQLREAINRKNIPICEMETDENGHLILEKLPENIRDWVLHG